MAAGGPLAYEPVALGWTAGEVERAGADQLVAMVDRAADSGRLGCQRQCRRIQGVFDRLLPIARVQSAHAAALRWTLIVVTLPDVEAMATPDGHVLVSEAFVDERVPHDEALAFVLAHEMAHAILEHERQTLTFARMLLPRQVKRTVEDMYVEIDHNFALLKAIEPSMQQGEYEADELGFQLASAAGFDPARQLAFMEWQSALDTGSRPLVSTHPPSAARLDRLRRQLPLAMRLVPPAPSPPTL